MATTISELVGQAVDVMSSQQAMPDEGALRELASIVRQAYDAGRASVVTDLEDLRNLEGLSRD